MNKKIVYITGCLGFIGSNVTRACLDRGWYVIGVDSMTYASNQHFLQEFQSHPTGKFKFIQSDINDLDRLYECDYIINTAAETHVDNSIESSDEFVRSNVNGVHHLLKLINAKKYQKPILLHFSTDEVYGDISEGAHIETDILRPSNPYSATKAAADQLITAWSRTYGLPYVIVRPTNNYGIGQYVEKLIPKACKFLSLGRKIPLHNDGTPIRNWLHAKDTARAVIKIVESKAKNEIYNIAGGFEQSNLSTVYKIIEEFYSDQEFTCSDKIDFNIHRPGQDVRYALNDSKIRALGWKPECIFDEEIKSIVQYYKKNFVW
jgi:dTDP-glucose 4,6-dehydratase